MEQIDVTEIPHLEHCYESHRKECVCGYDWYSGENKAIALNEDGNSVLWVQFNGTSFTFTGTYRYPIFKRHEFGCSILGEGTIVSGIPNKYFSDIMSAVEAAVEWYDTTWKFNQEPIFES